MARVFSHKPAVVMYDNEQHTFKHTGPIYTGYLYQVDEPVGPGNVAPMDSCIQIGWNTTKQFANFGFKVWRSLYKDSSYAMIQETWDTVRLDSSLLNYSFNDSAVAPYTKYYYKIQAKALNDSTLWIGPDSVVGVAGRPGERPGIFSFQLKQNKPNPFTERTIIEYQIASERMVHLVVYNILGQQVRTLVSGLQGPGMHQACWNGSDNNHRPAAAGLYYYRLSSPGVSMAKGMLKLR